MPDYRNRPAPDAPRTFDLSDHAVGILLFLALATIAALAVYMVAVAAGKAG